MTAEQSKVTPLRQMSLQKGWLKFITMKSTVKSNG